MGDNFRAPGVMMMMFAGLVDDFPSTPFVTDMANMTRILGDRIGFPIKYVIPRCKLSHLTVNVETNPATGGNSSFTVYKNGVATGLTITYAEGEVGIRRVFDSVPFNGTTDYLEMVWQLNATDAVGSNQATCVVS